MFHPFLTVQAGAPRHCLSIALALLAITSNITNYYYTRPPFRCAARACADAVLPAALHCSLLCISELCLRPNPCGIECTDCTAQYTLPEMGGSIEPPEPPLATGLCKAEMDQICRAIGDVGILKLLRWNNELFKGFFNLNRRASDCRYCYKKYIYIKIFFKTNFFNFMQRVSEKYSKPTFLIEGRMITLRSKTPTFYS